MMSYIGVNVVVVGCFFTNWALISAAAAEPVCVPAPYGLLSWWRGELERSSSELCDAVGANHGRSIAEGGIYRSPGKVGSGFGLRHPLPIYVTDSSSLRLTNGLTIEAWIYPSNSYGMRVIVGKFDQPSAAQTNSAYFFGLTNGLLCLGVSPNGSAKSAVWLLSGQRVSTNQWIHVAATYDATLLRLYQNGAVVAQTNYAAGIFPSSLAFGIGGLRDWRSTAQYGPWLPPWLPWVGGLDEISIYNRALSGTEISAIYDADSAGKCLVAPSIVAQPQRQVVQLREDVMLSVSTLGTGPLTYYWLFNDEPLLGTFEPRLVLEKVRINQVGSYSVLVSNILGAVLSSNATLRVELPAAMCGEVPPGVIGWWSGDNTNDYTGSSNSVTYGQTVIGKVGSAFYSDWVSRATVSNSPLLSFSTDVDFSIEAWAKCFPQSTNVADPAISSSRVVPVPSATRSLVAKRQLSYSHPPGNSGPGYALFLDEGRLGCSLMARLGTKTNSATFISAGPDLRDGMFHHVALTLAWTSTNGGTLYVDGQAVLSFDPTPCRGDLSNQSPLVIGGLSVYDAFRFGFDLPPLIGVVDELAIYNRALSAAEILAIRQNGAAGKCRTPAAIVAQPTDKIVATGSTASFSVVAKGTPYLKYQWRYNGTNLPGATDSSLTLTNVQVNRTGAYCVWVSNVFGRALSSNAVLRLNSAPVPMCTNVVVAAGVDCLAQASVNNGSFDPEGDAITVEQAPSGPYPLGPNRVVLRVTDSHGAMSEYSAFVFVVDQAPPVITCANVVVTNAHDQLTSRVTYSPMAADNCTGLSPVMCVPPSGTAFAIGTHTVFCTVSDAAGNSNQCAFQVIVRPGNTAPVPRIEVSPLAQFPDYTNLIVIAPDNRKATVKFDGLNSYDTDDTDFFFFWYEGTNLFSTNIVARQELRVGTHEITLALNDTFPLGASRASVTVEVITPAQAVGIIIELLESSDLPHRDMHKLKVRFAAAAAAFERGHTSVGILQLRGFEHEVRAQVARQYPALAEQLINAADAILLVLIRKHGPLQAAEE